jgi:hypothetical protein
MQNADDTTAQPTAADAEEITAEQPDTEAEPLIPAGDLQPVPAAVDAELDDSDGSSEANAAESN